MNLAVSHIHLKSRWGMREDSTSPHVSHYTILCHGGAPCTPILLLQLASITGTCLPTCALLGAIEVRSLLSLVAHVFVQILGDVILMQRQEARHAHLPHNPPAHNISPSILKTPTSQTMPGRSQASSKQRHDKTRPIGWTCLGHQRLIRKVQKMWDFDCVCTYHVLWGVLLGLLCLLGCLARTEPAHDKATHRQKHSVHTAPFLSSIAACMY